MPCDFGGAKAPFDVYVGEPKKGNHPLQNQASWLSSERGGAIPAEVMESFTKLLEIAEQNGVSFEELCVYAMEATEGISGGEDIGGIEAGTVPTATPVAPGFEKEKGEGQHQTPPPPLEAPQKPTSPAPLEAPPQAASAPEQSVTPAPQAAPQTPPPVVAPRKPEGFKEPHQE